VPVGLEVLLAGVEVSAISVSETVSVEETTVERVDSVTVTETEDTVVLASVAADDTLPVAVGTEDGMLNVTPASAQSAAAPIAVCSMNSAEQLC